MLEINRLKIIAKTASGDYGVDIPFSSGLFVLRVENTHGKSTCMNAIAYALGMEKALGLADVKLPFPPSLTKEIEDEEGRELPVISSQVLLEISNRVGGVATIRRQILGAAEDNVAEVYSGGIDEISGKVPQKMFLHREGDTTRTLGFYHWLSGFVGWKLPVVPTIDGREAPLYPAVFFPTWFVEQKKGWSSIQATTPLFLKIKEAKRRSIEFVLALETNAIINQKFKIKTAIDDLNYSWKYCKKTLALAASKLSGEVTGVPDEPEVKFDPFKVDIAIKDGDKWKSIQFLKSEAEAALDIFIKSLKEAEQNKGGDAEVLQKIDDCKHNIRLLTVEANGYDEEISYISQQIESATARADHLQEDRRKYEDLKKIGDLEALKETSLSSNSCPTCAQEISENLVNLGGLSPIFSLDESLDYIKEQVKVVLSLKEGLIRQKRLKLAELDQANRRISSLLDESRRLQSSVLVPDAVLLEENLRKKISLENLNSSYAEGISAILQARLELDKHIKEYRRLIESRRKLPQNILSITDSNKLSALRDYVVSLLSDFGFSSFKPELVEISEETYLPTREGFDLGFDTSASDGIRMIWSYLIGLFCVSKDFSANHPGVLVFDEPRQQEAKKLSFTALLKSASDACRDGGQIILATSEDEQILLESLGDTPHTLKSFPADEGKILRKFTV